MKILLLENTPQPNYQKVLEHLNIDYTLSTKLDQEYDGLIIPGGEDINPKLYNEEIDPLCGKIDDELDSQQLPIIKKFIEEKKPILGICRGHQFLNVALNGTLIQNIESDLNHRDIDKKDSFHQVTNNSGFMKQLYGETAVINSTHHQAIKVAGDGLKVVSVAPDGIIEACQHESLPIISVQFHPERLTLDYASDKTIDGMKIFNYFFETFFK